MRLRNDTDAVVQTVAFIVASAFFLGIIGALMVATSETPSEDVGTIQDASNRLDAERLADLLAGSPGIGWSGGADAIERLGLLTADGTELDDDHLDTLRGAAYDADPDNGKVDYVEALEGLGLPANGELGFHIRMAPVGLQKQLQEADLSHIATCYVADWPSISLSIKVNFSSDAQMVAEARAKVDAQMSFLTAQERDVIDSIGLGFDNAVNLRGFDITVDLGGGITAPLEAVINNADLLDGDLFIDQKQYLDSILGPELSDCHLLVIGSTVDHNSLTSNAVKDPVGTWTTSGGTLMVLGSSSQNFQWLEPIFTVGTATVNAAPAAPDISHPMLHEPYELDWPSYDNFGIGWDLKEEGAKASFDKFQHVITSDGEDILAVSHEGAFGSGRIFLTSFRPEDIADQDGLGPEEAGNFLNNMVLYSDRAHLYLDYGPTPPDGAAVSAAVRTTQIWDEDLGMINVRITILYWGL